MKLVTKVKFDSDLKEVQYVEKLVHEDEGFSEEVIQWSTDDEEMISHFLDLEMGFSWIIKRIHDKFPSAKGGRILLSKKSPEIEMIFDKEEDIDDMNLTDEIIKIIESSLQEDTKPKERIEKIDYTNRFEILRSVKD